MNLDDEIMGATPGTQREATGLSSQSFNQQTETTTPSTLSNSLLYLSSDEEPKNSSSPLSLSSSSSPPPSPNPSPYTRINLKSFERPKRLIEYDKDGVPHPYTEMRIPKSQVDNVLLAALNLPYDGCYDPVTGEAILEAEFDGLNYLEVGMIKMARRAASGDMDSFKYLVDRVAGKAKQAIETTNVNLTLQDVLSQMESQGTSTPTYPTASVDISHINLHELLDEEL